MLIAISTPMISDNNGIVNESTDTTTAIELSELEEKVEEYVQNERTRQITNGNYSANISLKDILEQNRITTTIIVTEGIRLGIFQKFEDLGIAPEKGAKGIEINNGWVGSVTSLNDVYAINYDTKDVFYINDGEIWKKTGKISVDKMMIDNLKQQ